METPSPFDLSTLHEVVVDLPDAPLRASVQGCWQRPAIGRGGILSGLRFLDLGASDRGRIWRFVHGRAAELAEFLRDRSSLGDLDLDEGLNVALLTRAVQFPPGTWIYRQGSHDSTHASVFFVHEGSVALVSRSAAGREVFLGRVGVGGLFGGLPLLSRQPHLESAVSEGHTVLLEIDPTSFRYMERVKPESAHRVSRALVARQMEHLRGVIERLGADG